MAKAARALAGLFRGLTAGVEGMIPVVERQRERGARRAEAAEMRQETLGLRAAERAEAQSIREFEQEQQREFGKEMAKLRVTLQEEAGVRKETRQAEQMRVLFEKSGLKETAGKHPLMGQLALRGDRGAMMALLSQRGKDDIREMQQFVKGWRRMSNKEFVEQARRMKPIMLRHGVPIRGPFGHAHVGTIARHLAMVGVPPEQLGEEGQKMIARQETGGLLKAGRRQEFLEALKPKAPKPTPEEKAEEKFRTERRTEELWRAQREGRAPAPAPAGPTTQSLADVVRRLPNEERVQMLRRLGSAAARGDAEAKEILREMGL